MSLIAIVASSVVCPSYGLHDKRTKLHTYNGKNVDQKSHPSPRRVSPSTTKDQARTAIASFLDPTGCPAGNASVKSWVGLIIASTLEMWLVWTSKNGRLLYRDPCEWVSAVT